MSTPYSSLDVVKVGNDLHALDPQSAEDFGTITPFISRCDPDFADAVNALWTKDIDAWPYSHAGSAIPMPLQGRDSPSCAEVVNWLAQTALGWFPGASVPASEVNQSPAGVQPVTSPYTLGIDAGRDDASGTIPYINPAVVKDPECAYIVNYCLDHSLGW